MIRRKRPFILSRLFGKPRDPHFRNLWRDERGASAIIIGLSLTALIGMVGLGIEVGAWYTGKRQLQSGADAGALGAAYKIYTSGNNSGLKAAAIADATRNGVVDGADGVTVLEPNNPPTSGAYVGDSDAVEVYITQSPQLLFSVLSLDSVTLRARAVARILELAEGCIIALNPNSPIGIQLQGSANLTLTGCGMFSNSESANSMVSAGGAQLQLIADYFAMVGGYQQSGSAVPQLVDPEDPLTGQSPMADPLAAMVADYPPAPAFTHNDPSFGNNETWAGEVGNSNNAVHFNDGLTFGSQANITIPASVTEIYVTGELKINAGAVVNCTCTFILMDAQSKVTINGNATVSVTAPDADLNPSARYPGIAFYNASPTSSVDSSFSGTGDVTINGALYFPNQHVDYRGNSVASMPCTKIVADSITFIGNTESVASTVGPNCPNYKGSVDWTPDLAPVLVE